MPYKSASIGRFYAIRWDHRIPAVDVIAVTKEIEDQRKSVGQPLLAMAVVPENFAIPDSESRKVFGDGLRKLFSSIERIDYVIEGSGFKSSILRSVVTNVLMLAGQRAKVTVHSSIGDALSALAPRLQEANLTAERVAAVLNLKGMFTPITPVDRGGLDESHPAP